MSYFSIYYFRGLLSSVLWAHLRAYSLESTDYLFWISESPQKEF